MKYFKTLEAYKWDMSSYHKKDERIYYFESEDWMYKVGVMDNIANKDFPYFGFKAKKGDDFFYDMSIVTNDNMYGKTAKKKKFFGTQKKKKNNFFFLKKI